MGIQGGWIPILPVSCKVLWDAGLSRWIPLFLTHCGLYAISPSVKECGISHLWMGGEHLFYS